MSINLTVVIDNDEAIKKFKELQKVAKSTTSDIVTDSDKMDMAIRKLGSALGAIGVSFSLTELARQVVTVRGEFQKLEVAFSTMLGSKAEADALMERTVELAATTPFNLQEVSKSTKQLLAYGSTAEEVTGEIKMLGDIASGLSMPLGDLAYLYGTTRTQGRLFTQDLRQFMGRGIPIAEELAKQFGVTKDKVGELVTAGKVGFPEVQKALQAMTSEGGKFYNLMEEQSKTISGQISNLKDSIQQMFNDIGKESEGAISTAIGSVSYLVENYESIGRVLIEIIAAYGSYKAAIMIVNTVQKARVAYLAAEAIALRTNTIAQTNYTAATVALSKAMKALNLTALTNPYVLAGVATTGLIYGTYKLITAKSAEEKAQERVNEAMEEYKKKLDEDNQKASQAASTMKDANASAYDRVKAYKLLVETYPELLAKYDEEKIKLMDLKDLNRELADINNERTMAELNSKKSSLESQIEAINSRKKVGVNGELTFANAMDAGQYKTLSEELKVVNQKIKEREELEKQAAFDALSVKEKLAEYERQKAQLESKIVEYTTRMNEAISLNDNYLASVYNDIIKNAQEQKAGVQKSIDALNKANKEQPTGDADAIAELAQRRQKAQDEAYKAEAEHYKSYLADKAMLLQFEMDQELAAIDKRIAASTDAEERGYLQRKRAATEALYLKNIDEALVADTPLLVPKVGSMFSKEQRDSMFQQNFPNVSEILREAAEKNIPAIEALFGDMRNKTSDDLNAIADAAEKMLATIKDPQELADLRDRIDELRDKANELESPLIGLKDGLKELFQFTPNTEGWNTAIGKIEKGLESIVDVAKGLDSVLESIGAGDAMNGVVDGLQTALDAFGAAKEGAKIGSAFGAIGAAAGAALGAVGSLVKSISEIHDKNKEKSIQRLQEQIDSLSRSYTKMGREIDAAYSADAAQMIEYQNHLLRQQQELIKKQMAEEEDKKNTDDDRIEEWQTQLDEIDQQIEDNAQKAKEALTGISFDSFRDSFLSSLSDMSKSSEDFAADFEDMLKKSILNALITEQYQDRIQALYDSFAAMAKDGLSSNEVKSLREQYQSLVDDMVADRENLQKIYGWSDENGAPSTTSTNGGFQTMSQETGSELNGRFTDIQGKVTEMRSYIMEMMTTGKMQYNEIVNIRDIMLQLNGNVADISVYTRVLPKMLDAINSMNKKLENL